MAEQLATRDDIDLTTVSGRITEKEGLDRWEGWHPNYKRTLPFPTRDVLRFWRVAQFPSLESPSSAFDWVYCPAEFFVPTRRARLAVTSHDILQDLTFGGERREAQLRSVFRRAGLVLSVSHFNTSKLLDVFPACAGKVARVPNAADDLFFDPATPRERREIRSLLALSDETPFLLSVANFQPRKNLELMLRALVRNPEVSGGRLAVVLVGTGAPDQAARLNAQINDLPAQTVVRLPGYLEGTRLRAAYAEATALVFPSTCESFGIPAVEAMSQGCPVVLANSTALPEVAQNAGWYFDPRKEDDLTATLGTLLAHGDERERRLGLGRGIAAGYRWSESCRLLVDALRQSTEISSPIHDKTQGHNASRTSRQTSGD
jgi:alpha-1,3-rhamnosyl/mannosyltransferase